MQRTARLAMSFATGLLLQAFVAAAQQTDNHVLHAVPVPAKVVVDGSLADWDLSGQTEVYANFKTRNSYSTKVAAMYDKDNLYLAIVWRDPTPMVNMIDSRYDIGFGWRSDCVQLRVRTDMVMHLDCWYSTAAKHPVINIAYGRWTGGRDADDATAFNGINDALTVGAQQAFRMGEDGKSYTQEMALPWKLITGQAAIVKQSGKPYREPKTYGPGDSFNMGMEFLWGPADGRTFPIHRYADFLKEGKSSREFFWTAVDDWGTVKLEPKGDLSLPKADTAATEAYTQRTEGPVALRYDMPFDGFATLVVEDSQGRRVRNLIGVAPRAKGRQVDYWDGTDEEGKLAAPGSYRWRGLVHQGIDPAYEASYGTAGVPPWDTADGTGAWMSDHNMPTAVAAASNLVVLAAGGSEGGWALIATDLNGRKKWGERKFQGIRALAADATHVYAGMNEGAWGREEAPPSVGRVELQTGKYAPFATQPEPQLIVPVAEKSEKATLKGIAVHDKTLAVALAGVNEVRLFDKNTMRQQGKYPVSDPRGVCFRADGVLLALTGAGIVGLSGNAVADLGKDHLGNPVDIAIDAQGNLYVADAAANQIQVLDRNGKFLRSIGAPGGRPQPGKWMPGAMLNPAGVDVDAAGRVWVAEENMWPKRISVWNADGTLAIDLIGPTTYGGMGAAADPADKTRVFGNGCEFRLNYESNRAEVVANLIANNLVGDLVKHDGREYFMSKRGELHIRRGQALVPVARFGLTNMRDLAKLDLPLKPPEGVKDAFGYLWCDLNDDGQPQADEVQTTLAHLSEGYWGGYWLDGQFTLWAGPDGYGRMTLGCIPLKGWTKGGAPIWDVNQFKVVAERAAAGPNKLYLATDNLVVCGSPMVAIRPDGTVPWTFRDNWNDVHGSHLAPIPDRDDMLIGTLSCIGTATSPIGELFALNSNMGRLYVFTLDGLLAANVFQDCRIGSDPWPAEAKRGAPLGGVTMGGEWFGGYFFMAEKTKEYYLIAGGTSYNLIKLNGLDKLQPLKGAAVEFSGKDLIAAERLQQQRAAAKATAQKLSITRLDKAPAIDGKLDEYPAASFVEWASGSYRIRGALAADGTNLYLACDVGGDANPMVNGGKDWTQLFTTGDSIDLQLGTNPGADPQRTEPVAGDLRLLVSVLDQQPVAVLYRWKAKDGEKHPVTFASPWRKYTMDDVTRVADARIQIARRGDGYAVEAAVPLQSLGFALEAGKEYKADLGVICSDPTGNNRSARVYWSNKATGLVNDVPGEIMATPNLWGTAVLSK